MSDRFSPTLNSEDRGDLDEICFEYGFTNRTDVIRRLLNVACRTEKDGGRVLLHDPKCAAPIQIRVRP